VALDIRDGVGPNIVFEDRMDEDQELPASEARTSGVAIGGSDYRNKPTSEYS